MSNVESAEAKAQELNQLLSELGEFITIDDGQNPDTDFDQIENDQATYNRNGDLIQGPEMLGYSKKYLCMYQDGSVDFGRFMEPGLWVTPNCKEEQWPIGYWPATAK